MRLIPARVLPDDPLDASAEFLSRVVPEVRAAIGAADLAACIVFDPADHRHRGWRLAAIQSLGREAAPGRVNAVAVAVAEEATLRSAVTYLETAPGVTGQYLPLDGHGAGDALG